jgi:hypothetical protein
MVSALREVDTLRRNAETKVVAISEQPTNAGSNRGLATNIICSFGDLRLEAVYFAD